MTLDELLLELQEIKALHETAGSLQVVKISKRRVKELRAIKGYICTEKISDQKIVLFF